MIKSNVNNKVSDLNKFKKYVKYSMEAFGFNPLKILLLKQYPKFISHCRRFEMMNGKITSMYPILSDYTDVAGTAKGHYFHQDLLVAQFVYLSNPTRHIDIGSRIDGFVAHIASYRKIEVMDVRDLNNTGHRNIVFLKSDLMDNKDIQPDITDSISCLHAIEHFGLGRYGDNIDPDGHIKGFNNILKMLNKNGILYISFPIGKSNQVCFNAHRIFSPKDIFNWSKGDSELQLMRFDYVDDSGDIHINVDLTNNIIEVNYGCGIYTFKKIK
jgi:hypothetical protein